MDESKMKNYEIIDLAKQATSIDVGYSVWTLSTPHLVEFARLVAIKEHERIAQFCDDLDDKFWKETGEYKKGYGDLIRALGNRK